MYETFYRFREKPFHVTADPAFLFLSRQHQEALDHLTYGIRERLGFIVITGEVGTGKTTLAKALVERLSPDTQTALILNPALSGTPFLQSILKDFGAASNGTRLSRGELLQKIEQFLLSQAGSQTGGVLIIDEAQALSSSALEQVRLLSNVETPKTKLIQIVLIGQPELTERLNRERRLRALRQRIAVWYELKSLSPDEVAPYIRHRIHVACSEEPPLFTEGALTKIARLSEGIPRRINGLCDQALLAGFVKESRAIDEELIKED